MSAWEIVFANELPTKVTTCSWGSAMSPVGRLCLVTLDDVVMSISFVRPGKRDVHLKAHAREHGCETICHDDDWAKTWVDAVFADQHAAEPTRLQACGTPFQIKVWQALQTIPYGKTCSYQAIADQIGQPTAVRAVAQAIGANPLGVVLPCHRVIRANGELGGFAGGLPIKRALLAYEAQADSDATTMVQRFDLPQAAC